jgi:hypothetical protein
MDDAVPAVAVLQAWDPLADTGDPGMLNAAQKREIRNILRSYTGYYDLFSELVQNSLDAVERRTREGDYRGVQPAIWLTVDLVENSITVTDNGCGMSMEEFRSFLRPNISFKLSSDTRGSKGVGVTYLAYGFNYLEVATKQSEKTTYAGLLENGRKWVDDTDDVVSRPKVVRGGVPDEIFHRIDKGTSIKLKLVGDTIRPKNLSYLGARTAKQWMAVLRAETPIGGIYLCDSPVPSIKISLRVIAEEGEGRSTSETLDAPRYLYPHEVIGRTADLRDFLKDQEARARKQQDLSKIPPKFQKLNGIWGEWTGEQILSNESPFTIRLDEDERDALRELDIRLYIFMGFSTELWDEYNDKILGLRKGARLLRGGLQQATRHMPQGEPITIPLTESIGFQQVTHVIVHYANAEPDLGRKGFQPENTHLAERVAVSATRAFKKHNARLLRKQIGAPALVSGMRLSQWIDQQRQHEVTDPLSIKGRGLFAPAEELPITSAPRVEQDVVALFNQMLSSGLIRGIQLLSSSQYNQYDGLYRISMNPPFEKYKYDDTNPLGADPDQFVGVNEPVVSPVQILEYKYTVDSLIEEFLTEDKKADDVGLVVAWQMGSRYAEMFDVLSYLDQGLGKVPECRFHGLVMPRSGRTRVASRALRRSAAAMLRWPWARRRPMARLRRLAMVRGVLPVRAWEASSAKVVSRMWCSASMAQWPRM